MTLITRIRYKPLRLATAPSSREFFEVGLKGSAFNYPER
jgi:hypothetical protein